MTEIIKIVHGDLLDATENIIGHQVNCHGKMYSGVAKAIRNKYPEVYTEYYKKWRISETDKLLGQCQLVTCSDGKIVSNLFGQKDFGYDGKQYTDINALTNAMIELRNFAFLNNKTVALPYKIGSDRGGAEWNVVKGIIDEVFSDYEVTLYRLET